MPGAVIFRWVTRTALGSPVVTDVGDDAKGDLLRDFAPVARLVVGQALSPPLTRDEAGGLLGQTMGLVALTAGVFTLGAYVGRDIGGGWGIVFFIVARQLTKRWEIA